MLIIGILTSIILFSIIVIIHELGHFAAARKFGVRVEEFGLGIPPRAKKLFKDKKGTLFSLNWLPLGGFVKLTGEMPNTFLVYNKNGKQYNNEALEKGIKNNIDIFYKNGEKVGKTEIDLIINKLEENRASYNLANKPSWQQAIIILAGVFMNFMLAWIIFSILFFVGVSPVGINTKIETDLDLKLIPNKTQAIESGLIIHNTGIILHPIDGSTAEKSGIIKGDILIGILEENNNYIQINKPEELIKIISNNVNKTINLKINDSFIKIKIPKSGKIGTYISENIEINKEFKYKYGIIDSIKYGAIETKNQILLTFKGLSILIKKIVNPEKPEERTEAIKQVSGPIGIVDFISKSLKSGFVFLIIIGAIISVNLGVFNLLPIPALDGGRFLFITVNGVIKKIFGRKAISENIEGYIHVGFLVLLIALSLLIAYNDIGKIISN